MSRTALVEYSKYSLEIDKRCLGVEKTRSYGCTKLVSNYCPASLKQVLYTTYIS